MSPAQASTEVPPIHSARPDLTADLMAQTGLDEGLLSKLVHRFYARVRADTVLGPIFAERSEGIRISSEWSPSGRRSR